MVSIGAVRLARNRFGQSQRYFARTVMVKDGDPERAFRTLNRLMAQEGLLDDLRRRRYHEPHYQRRNRISFELCKAIYRDDMKRKIEFLMRKNRVDPCPFS